MSFSHVCSLGTICHTGRFMQRLKIKNSSYPFDWVFSDSKGVIDCLQDGFDKLLDPPPLLNAELLLKFLFLFTLLPGLAVIHYIMKTFFSIRILVIKMITNTIKDVLIDLKSCVIHKKRNSLFFSYPPKILNTHQILV